jgi:UDP-N-acetylmuramoylalanine-D-glutamate ligase
VLAVELSSFQLHWAPSLRPEAGVVLNIAEDHLDWHATMDDYAADKAGVLRGRVAVAGLDDPRAAELLAAAPAPVRVGFRLGEPAAGELGVRDGMLVDRAFAAGPDGLALAAVSSIPVPGPVGVLDALAAAALARSIGVPGDAIATALASFQVAGTEPSWWPSSTRSATSTTPRPRTRMPPRHPCWPTREWCGSPGVCSRAHRCMRPWPRSLRGWSERC